MIRANFEFQIARNERHKRKCDFVLSTRLGDTIFSRLIPTIGCLDLREMPVKRVARGLLKKLKQLNWTKDLLQRYGYDNKMIYITLQFGYPRGFEKEYTSMSLWSNSNPLNAIFPFNWFCYQQVI